MSDPEDEASVEDLDGEPDAETSEPDPLGAELAEPSGRWSRMRSGLPRAVTISIKKRRPESLGVLRDFEYVDQFDRPRSRGDCLPGGRNQHRPCPWVSCRHHLYIDVSPDTGSLKINFPSLEPWEIEQSCSLDVADKGGITLDETGQTLALTRERARQIEVRALHRLKITSPEATSSDEFVHTDPATYVRPAPRKGGRRRRF